MGLVPGILTATQLADLLSEASLGLMMRDLMSRYSDFIAAIAGDRLVRAGHAMLLSRREMEVLTTVVRTIYERLRTVLLNMCFDLING